MSPSSAHRHYSQCASTNDIARAWALDTADPAPHGALVSADFQTRGRGRRGRQWQAKGGESALMSVVLRPALARSEAWQLAFIAALAVSDALGAYVTPVNLKWPNDILIQGNKAGGVLVETVGSTGRGWAAIVGIGVNVSQTRFDNSPSFQVPPISLRMAVGQTPPVAALIQEIAFALEQRLAQRTEEGWETTRADWRARMALNIAFQRGQEQGIFEELEPDGQARVRLPGGTIARWATVDPEDTANSAPNRV